MIANRNFSLAVNEESPQTVRGNFIRCLASAGQLLQVHTENMDGTTSTFEMEAGLAFGVKTFEKLRIRNKGNTTAVCKFVFSDEGFIQDNRLVGNLDLNGSISVLSTLPRYTRYESTNIVGNGEVTVAPLNESRRRLYVVPSAAIEVKDGKTTSEPFEWNTQQELIVLNSDGVTVEIYEDFD